MDAIKNYPVLQPEEVQLIGDGGAADGTVRQLFLIHTPFGYKRMGEIIRPGVGEHLPVVLFLHWYEPDAHDSNRHQFEAQATALARQGVVCLLVETLWSDLDFFFKRTQADDLKNSIEEAVNIRRLIDLLLSQPGVDPSRFAVVGHDFGGMYAVLAGAIDQRPTHYVIMAATPRFPDWYLYFPEIKGDAREAFIADIAPFDPISNIAALSPASLLFQFGNVDPHVPKEQANEFFAAAKEPKRCQRYECGHGLNDAAAQDRMDWLKEMFQIPSEK